MSARQIERVFRERVGLSPKVFLRIVRFQEVLGGLRFEATDRGRPWAEIAARHGFYDQAHFIRDFKLFVGESPGAWSITPESLAAVSSARWGVIGFGGYRTTDGVPGFRGFRVRGSVPRFGFWCRRVSATANPGTEPGTPEPRNPR